MVPATVMLLDEIPLTPVGKLDRQALPAPVFEAREFRAPVGRDEELVATVFADLLGVDQVGRDDDFFELGGNSLIATQVVARLSAAGRAQIPVRAVFRGLDRRGARRPDPGRLRRSCAQGTHGRAAPGPDPAVACAAADVVPEPVRARLDGEQHSGRDPVDRSSRRTGPAGGCGGRGGTPRVAAHRLPPPSTVSGTRWCGRPPRSASCCRWTPSLPTIFSSGSLR